MVCTTLKMKDCYIQIPLEECKKCSSFIKMRSDNLVLCRYFKSYNIVALVMPGLNTGVKNVHCPCIPTGRENCLRSN